MKSVVAIYRLREGKVICKHVTRLVKKITKVQTQRGLPIDYAKFKERYYPVSWTESYMWVRYTGEAVIDGKRQFIQAWTPKGQEPLYWGYNTDYPKISHTDASLALWGWVNIGDVYKYKVVPNQCMAAKEIKNRLGIDIRLPKP